MAMMNQTQLLYLGFGRTQHSVGDHVTNTVVLCTRESSVGSTCCCSRYQGRYLSSFFEIGVGRFSLSKAFSSFTRFHLSSFSKETIFQPTYVHTACFPQCHASWISVQLSVSGSFRWRLWTGGLLSFALQFHYRLYKCNQYSLNRTTPCLESDWTFFSARFQSHISAQFLLSLLRLLVDLDQSYFTHGRLAILKFSCLPLKS